jgi:hypothetical protein
MKEKGYDQGQLSYHNLLYPNEVDMRKILMWLTQQLPSRDSPGLAKGSFLFFSLFYFHIVFFVFVEFKITCSFLDFVFIR